MCIVLLPPGVSPIAVNRYTNISNACWGSVGTDVSFLSLALFVLFILQFRWTVSYYPACVLTQCNLHIQNPIGLTYVIHR